MAEDKTEDIKEMGARHPIRTLGAAFMAGAVVGMGMAKAKKESSKPGWQKFLDKLEM